jgi:hypothetical protein
MLFLAVTTLAPLQSCRQAGDSNDVELQPVQSLLRKELPPGTTQDTVQPS